MYHVTDCGNRQQLNTDISDYHFKSGSQLLAEPVTGQKYSQLCVAWLNLCAVWAMWEKMATVEVWTNPSPSWLSGQACIDENSMCEVAKSLKLWLRNKNSLHNNTDFQKSVNVKVWSSAFILWTSTPTDVLQHVQQQHHKDFIFWF